MTADDNWTDEEPEDEPEDARGFLQFIATISVFTGASIATAVVIGYLMGRAS